MTLGIGCDIVEHTLTKTLNWQSDVATINRTMSLPEIQLLEVASDKINFLSGRFAAKEALLKCLGTGMRDGISLTDIQVLQLESGAPKIELTGKVKKLSDKFGVNRWLVSISHSPNCSLAFVLAES